MIGQVRVGYTDVIQWLGCDASSDLGMLQKPWLGGEV